jgi:mannose-6-phosphate isomerase
MIVSAYRLEGKVQNYPWGGYQFIPELLGIQPQSNVPCAEYWLGGHAKAPSDVVLPDKSHIPLNDLVDKYPNEVLGTSVAQNSEQLPFLLKILDVRETLSIQVHPNKYQAEAGFEKEDRLGIPIQSAERNYRDNNHKPELQLAIGDYWLLHGFREKESLRSLLEQIPEFSVLAPIFASDNYLELYKYVMEIPQGEVNRILAPLSERIVPEYLKGSFDESSPDYWAAKSLESGSSENYDRGVFSIYFFNLLMLKKGQAIFQGAGIPHAALRGQCVELMANSDNVVRGGLTPKHIDVPQLLSLTRFNGLKPIIINGSIRNNQSELFYETSCPDFCLSRIQLHNGDVFINRTFSAEIILVLSGQIAINSSDAQLNLTRGESAVILAKKEYQIDTLEDAVLFRASLPSSNEPQ